MIVVSDSSVLIALGAIGRLDLLRAIYTEVFIPEAVFTEITVESVSLPGAAEIAEAGWIVVCPVTDKILVRTLRAELDLGESEALVLGVELKAGLVLMDERRGRKMARRMGLDVVGVLGVLVEAKKKGLLAEVGSTLAALVGTVGFRIDDDLYRRVLEAVGED